MDNLQNKVISIAKIEQFEKLIKIIDQDKSKYNLWFTKKDGNNTQAYDQYLVLALRVGSDVEVGYKIEPKTFTNQEGKVINYDERTIIGFRETNGIKPAQRPTPAIKTSPEPRFERTEEDKPDWEAITRGKVASLLAQGYLAGGKNAFELATEMTSLIKCADDLIKLSASYSAEKPQVNDEIDVSEIPF